MRLSILLSSFTLGAALLLSGGAARAAHGHGHHAEEEESEYPLSYVERPLTLPRMTLAPELELEFGRAEAVVTGPGAGGAGRETVAGINIGASFGITKDLEVGAFILPLQFAPRVSYGSVGEPESNLQIFGTYRFFHTRQFEIGARLRAYIITDLAAGTQITPSVPMVFHFGRVARLDAEVAVPIRAQGGGVGAHVGLNVPLAVSFDIIEPLHVGVSTGVFISEFDHPKQSAAIPLGVFAGFAVGHKKPIVDIDAFFRFADFVAPGGGVGNETINAGDFQTGIAVRGYLYF